MLPNHRLSDYLYRQLFVGDEEPTVVQNPPDNESVSLYQLISL